MLLGVADAAGGKGLHTRIMPPERWQKMSTAKKQKSIRISTLNKVAGMMHIPQNTLREQYLGDGLPAHRARSCGICPRPLVRCRPAQFFPVRQGPVGRNYQSACPGREGERKGAAERDCEKKAKEEKKKKDRTGTGTPEKRTGRSGSTGYPGRTRGEETPCKDSVNPVRRVLMPVIPVEDHAAVNFLSPVSPGFKTEMVDNKIAVDSFCKFDQGRDHLDGRADRVDDIGPPVQGNIR